MFVLRGIAVSLTFFILVYGLLSLLVVCAWRLAKLLGNSPARRRANLLFWLRVGPLLASAAVTLALVVPAYVRLEPRSVDEDIALPVVLGAACLLLFGLGIVRIVTAHKKSSRVVANWLRGANLLDSSLGANTFEATQEVPPLTLVGVCVPRVVVSQTTMAILSRDELRVAVQHEVAHMRSRDNLKKLIFHCSPFPGMVALEGAWGESAELAADAEAVNSLREAVDLAAALIKLSRLASVKVTPHFTMALVIGNMSLAERVSRLLAWRETSQTPAGRRWGIAIPALLAAGLVMVATNAPVLAHIHKVSEWFVH